MRHNIGKHQKPTTLFLIWERTAPNVKIFIVQDEISFNVDGMCEGAWICLPIREVLINKNAVGINIRLYFLKIVQNSTLQSWLIYLLIIILLYKIQLHINAFENIVNQKALSILYQHAILAYNPSLVIKVWLKAWPSTKPYPRFDMGAAIRMCSQVDSNFRKQTAIMCVCQLMRFTAMKHPLRICVMCTSLANNFLRKM